MNDITLKEYGEYHMKDNNERIENTQNQILSSLKELEAGLKLQKSLASEGNYNSIDAFCKDAVQELIQIMMYNGRIRTAKAENAAHRDWIKIFENVKKGEQA